MTTSKTQTLVIGTGVAGLSLALKLAEHRQVLLVSKAKLSATNTNMAQGGIASVQGVEDRFENHIQDTLRAGAGLCQEDVVRRVVQDAPTRIADLIQWGVNFDGEQDYLGSPPALTKEGGHSHRRILHVQDQTGRAIQEALSRKVVEHPNIEIIENRMALELSISPLEQRCTGTWFLNIDSGDIELYQSPVTVLATGGAGKVYLYTSNWEGATGDGVAMAFRAGCRVSNMEFVQFHPTCLYHPQARNFLISEALRGEGAELVNHRGKAFTYQFDKRGPLAPRDIVARAIDFEMKSSGAESVFLDIRHKGREFIKKRFPKIYEQCSRLGYDLATTPLPVVPAAHYQCGGIVTDSHGATDIKGLYAVGECAYTGLHGANRLASNSLLECLAYSHYASETVVRTSPSSLDFPTPHSQPKTIAKWQHQSSESNEMILITHLWDEVRTCMWNYVGIVRSDKRLALAKKRLDNIWLEILDYTENFALHPDIVELRNLATVARLSVESALLRQGSIGAHYSADQPKPPLNPNPSVLDPKDWAQLI